MTVQLDPVEKGLSELATESVEPNHFPRMMAKVRANKERKSPMNSMIKSGALAGGLAIAAVVAMVLIPATYEVSVGTLIKAEFKLPDGISPRAVADATTSVAEGQKMLMVENGVTTLTIASKATDSKSLEEKLQKTLQAQFPAIAEISVTTEPIKERRGGNALAAVTGGRIEIGCEGMSDAEIEGAIAGALSAHGLNVKQVSVSTTFPGEGQIERRVEIQAEGDSSYAVDGLPELDLQIGGMPNGEGHEERIIVRETNP